MAKGDEFYVKCHYCGKIEKKYVNDFNTEPGIAIVLAGIAIGISVIIFLWTHFGTAGTVSAIIPLILWQQQMNAAKSFHSNTKRRK
jgi:hypothetical protein